MIDIHKKLKMYRPEKNKLLKIINSFVKFFLSDITVKFR